MAGLKTKKWTAILSAAGNLLNHSGASKATAYSGISSEGEMFDPRAAVDDSDEYEDC
jgi:hypothetical protein